MSGMTAAFAPVAERRDNRFRQTSRDPKMTSIDFRQKLHDAHAEVFAGDRLIIADLLNEDVDLDRLFLELCDAAEDRGAEVSVGTVDELRALLLADPDGLHGSLTPVGPSLKVVWNGKVRRFCLGVDPDASAEGGDGFRLRLLSWKGTWPGVEFDMSRGVKTIDELFDALVCEVAAIQQEAQAVARIIDDGKPRKSAPLHLENGTKVGNYLALAGSVSFVVPLALWLVAAFSLDYGKLVVAGLSLGGLLFVASGFHHLKHAAETSGQEVRYSEGIWRLLIGAALIAIPALVSMMTTTVYISPNYGFPPASF
jgi:hypothetical protein